MDDDEFLALTKRLDALRAEHRKSKSKDYPPSAKLLEDMLLNLDPLDEEAFALRGLLADEYCLHDRLEKWEDLARFETKLFPDEPVPWISLAGFLLHAKEDFVEALATVDVAIKKAEQKGEWVRHAYCTRARIARAMEDFGLLEATIKHLIDYQPTPGSIDIHLEHDFVATMPVGKINEEILAKYNALKSAKTGPFKWPGPAPD